MDDSQVQTPTEAAREYLDAAIRRHREFGDDQGVPQDVYERALTRATETLVEFRELGNRRATK